MKTIVKCFRNRAIYEYRNKDLEYEKIIKLSYNVIERDINTYAEGNNLDIVSINPDPFGSVWVIFKTKE